MNKTLNILFIVLSFSTMLLSFEKNYILSGKTFNIDLARRVYSVKLLEAKKPPYFLSYSSSNNMTVCYGFASGHDSLTASTPSALFFHNLLMTNDYQSHQKIWFYLQWLFLVLTVVLLYNSTNNTTCKLATVFFGFVFIPSTTFWELHLERGQIYIFYTFLLSFAYWIAKKDQKLNFLSGLIVGITATFRLHALLFILPAIFNKSYSFVRGVAAGFLSFILFTVYLYGADIWISYFKVLNFFNRLSQGTVGGLSPIPTYVDESFSKVAGGVSYMLPMGFSNSSIQHLFKENLHLGLSFPVLIFLLFFVLIIFSFYFYKNTARNLTVDQIFFVGISLLLLSEHFTIYSRYSYCNVIWLLVFALSIHLYKDLQYKYSSLLVLFISPILVYLFRDVSEGVLLVGDFSMLLYSLLLNLILLRSLKAS